MKKLVNQLVGSIGYAFSKKFSLQQVLRHCNPALVIDVGANTGQFLREVTSALPFVKIVCFEPNPEAFWLLSENSKQYQGVLLYNVAVGSAVGKTPLHVSAFSPSSSVLPMAARHLSEFPFTVTKGTIDVPVTTLDQVFASESITEDTLCKLDVQGFELEVLRGASHTLTRVRYIIIETSFVELYEGSPLFEHIYEYLSERGFRLQDVLQVSRSPANGVALYADLLFARRQ
jgi:FkbM family methyltransferase